MNEHVIIIALIIVIIIILLYRNREGYSEYTPSQFERDFSYPSIYRYGARITKDPAGLTMQDYYLENQAALAQGMSPELKGDRKYFRPQVGYPDYLL